MAASVRPNALEPPRRPFNGLCIPVQDNVRRRFEEGKDAGRVGAVGIHHRLCRAFRMAGWGPLRRAGGGRQRSAHRRHTVGSTPLYLDLDIFSYVSVVGLPVAVSIVVPSVCTANSWGCRYLPFTLDRTVGPWTMPCVRVRAFNHVSARQSPAPKRGSTRNAPA